MKVATGIAGMNFICALLCWCNRKNSKETRHAVSIFLAAMTMGADNSREIKGVGTEDQGALECLTELVYQELHRMAHRHLRNERVGSSLQATAQFINV
jgi:hypothetical protein